MNLFELVEGGDVAAVVQLLAAGDVAPNVCNGKGYSPLMLAAAAGHASMVSALLYDNGTDPNYCNRYGWGALREAVRACQPDIVQLLLRNDAVRVDVLDEMQETPLIEAIHAFASKDFDQRKGLEVVRLLVAAGAKVNHKPPFSLDPFSIAAKNGNIVALDTMARYVTVETKSRALVTALECKKFPRVVSYLWGLKCNDPVNDTDLMVKALIAPLNPRSYCMVPKRMLVAVVEPLVSDRLFSGLLMLCWVANHDESPLPKELMQLIIAHYIGSELLGAIGEGISQDAWYANAVASYKGFRRQQYGIKLAAKRSLSKTPFFNFDGRRTLRAVVTGDAACVSDDQASGCNAPLVAACIGVGAVVGDSLKDYKLTRQP